MDESLKEKLKDYFLTFGARNSLSEPAMEKIERVIHHFSLDSFEDVEEICEYIVRNELHEKPEEDIISDIKKEKLLG